jgi:uncharacterized protein YceH (UPF0502 family)
MDASSNIPNATEPIPHSNAISVLISPVAARVLGCLIEKEIATPDIYPLSLNALTNACNQRSNRDPLMSLSESDVTAALDELRLHKLAVVFSGAESRVAKYKHKLEQVFPMDELARALMCELFVRGAQTTASLRSNAARLHRMPEAEQVEQALLELNQRISGPLVKKLQRQSGQKEGRWAHLLSGEPSVQSEDETVVVRQVPGDLERRVDELEATVSKLKADVELLNSLLK